jgi:uncharacterized protein
MAVTTQYVVTHKGEEKLVTTDKREADQYDKMLDIGDNLASYLAQNGVNADDAVLEEIGILLSKNKEDVLKLLRGKPLEDVAGDTSESDTQ